MLETAIICLALNIYHEARAEDVIGQKAVAQVTMTRAKNDPSKVCNVVFKPMQFSWANPLTTVDKETRKKRANDFLPTDEDAWKIAKSIAKKAVHGKLGNIVSNASFYYNPKKVSPYWKKNMIVVAKLGNHIFLRQKT